jgi:hypothetical protein
MDGGGKDLWGVKEILAPEQVGDHFVTDNEEDKIEN